MWSKQRSWYNLSSEKKKKNAEEVVFAFKIFYKIFVEEHDSFCGLTLRGKSGLEFKDFKYRTL